MIDVDAQNEGIQWAGSIRWVERFMQASLRYPGFCQMKSFPIVVNMFNIVVACSIFAFVRAAVLSLLFILSISQPFTLHPHRWYGLVTILPTLCKMKILPEKQSIEQDNAITLLIPTTTRYPCLSPRYKSHGDSVHFIMDPPRPLLCKNWFSSTD